jgi:hypothetical protein
MAKKVKASGLTYAEYYALVEKKAKEGKSAEPPKKADRPVEPPKKADRPVEPPKKADKPEITNASAVKFSTPRKLDRGNGIATPVQGYMNKVE